MDTRTVISKLTSAKFIGLIVASLMLSACFNSNTKYDTPEEPYQRATVTIVKDVSAIIRNHYYPSYVGLMTDNLYDENNISSASVWNDRADIELLRDVSIKTDKGKLLRVRQDRRYKFKKGEVVKLVERGGTALVIPFKTY